MNLPILIQPAVDGEWGEVHENIIDDAITRSEWELQNYGGVTAMRWIERLRELALKRVWRSAAAAAQIMKINRIALAEIAEARNAVKREI